MKRIVGIAAALMIAGTGAAFAQDFEGGDAKKGKRVFNKCKACHMVGEKAKDRVGPVLNGIIGKQAASSESYASKYSNFLKDKAEEIGTWEPAEIITYARDPSEFIGGKSKMTKQKMKDDQAADLIAYLKSFDADGKEAE